jgi:hypothetical protein
MANQALETVGRMLVLKVRDRAVTDWLSLVNGKMKGARAAKVTRLLETFTPEQLEVVGKIIPEVVDTTLHHLLFELEQNETVRIAVDGEGSSVPDLKAVSDGLAGELVDWVPRFAKTPHGTIGF